MLLLQKRDTDYGSFVQREDAEKASFFLLQQNMHRTCTEHATLELPIFGDCGRQGLYGIIILVFCMDFAVTVPQKGGRTDANTGLDREK